MFAYHGYPWLIHRLTYRRTNHGNLHVRGYKEEGTITTPFDMAVLNDLDRFHLARTPSTGSPAARDPTASHVVAELDAKLAEHLRLHLRAWRRHARDPELALGLG